MSVRDIIQAAAGVGGGEAGTYIEDVFSTYLYTGNNSTQTITNGIDLAGEGGMVWQKCRDVATGHHVVDTERGRGYYLITSQDNAQTSTSASYDVTSFNSDGFSLSTPGSGLVNVSPRTYASWTFRKAPKFFDVVTYTGNGSTQNIAHNLGSTPGCIIVKKVSNVDDWVVWHRSLANNQYLILNSTTNTQSSNNIWNNTAPTSTQFSVGLSGYTNDSSTTYVAYLFAHDAGGFGDAGDQNVVSCGSYTGNGSLSGPVVTLGYEPQWVLVKRTDSTGNWLLQDNMRSLSLTNTDMLFPNLGNAATTGAYPSVVPTATGFYIGDNGTNYNASGGTYIYIAIRRGPMKTPESGTEVFGTRVRNGDDTSSPLITPTTALTTDLTMTMNRSGGAGGSFSQGAVGGFVIFDRLRGSYKALYTISLNPEPSPGSVGFKFDRQNGIQGTSLDAGQFFNYDTNTAGYSYINYFLRRAPGFFDVVCYTGNATSNRNITHNLGVAVELLIVKRRDVTDEWTVRAPNTTGELYLSRTNAQNSSFSYLGTSNATTFTLLSSGSQVNGSGSTYVAYLFASCPGVSKVGSYTGTGTTKQVNCGFSSGARFVLIKRTDSTGDWYVWDSARGIVAGNDPYLLVNSSAAEVTSTDYVDTYSAGFEISSTAPAAINANGGTFIYLAIA